MRYTDDGYISTEVELPSDSSRLIDFKYYGDKFGPKRMYARALIDVYGQPTSVKGYWRYVDIPEKEKRDSGHPSAFYGYLGELRDIVSGLSDVLDNFQDETGELLDSLDEILESEKLDEERDRLSQEGWISAEDYIPKCYSPHYEVMKDGKNLGKAHAYTFGKETGWTIHVPLQNIERKGTYWRPMVNPWQKSTPENLAKLASQEVVEVKTEDGEIYKGIVHGTITKWHLGKPDCMYMEGGTANDGTGDCVILSVDGTWFRRLAPKNNKQ